MKKWIQDNPWLALIGAILIGALFFAAPVALVFLKVKQLAFGTAATGGAAANPQEQVNQKATH